MAKTAMSITSFVKMAKVLPIDTSVLIRADHGVGKSQIISQLAEHFRNTNYDGKDFPLIDKRLSQLSEGDLLGLPYTDGIVTVFNLPADIQMACDKPCVLFLDEINRATNELQQAAFELVLDRSLQGRKLHPGTRVYAAVNTGSAYMVNEMDPALLDRFWCIDLEPTVEEWLSWAKTNSDMCDLVCDYIRLNDKFLDPPNNTEPGTVSTSRRSWHRLSRALKLAELDDKPEDPDFYMLCLGFVGVEAAMSFVDYAKNIEKQISAEDIMTKMVKKLGKNDVKYTGFGKDHLLSTPERIADKKFDDNTYNTKFVQRIKDTPQERLVGLLEKVSDYAKNLVDASPTKELTQTQGVSLGKFISLLPAELRVSVWAKLTEQGTDNIELIKTVHKYCVGHILSVFDVPLDSDGTIQPNIPDFIKAS